MRRGIHLLSGKPCAGGSEEQQKSMTYASSFEAVSTQGPFRARRGNTENMSAAFVAKEQRLRRSKHQGGVTPRRTNLILRMSDALGRPLIGPRWTDKFVVYVCTDRKTTNCRFSQEFHNTNKPRCSIDYIRHYIGPRINFMLIFRA